ncbi:hypothetical protein [Desnuesiella massiliensis]|uniref:hypothetical protein n=1 Tax=Desnuesiella massiliensis TaxID=1650662 RepID=UPI0006E15C78|nr:hypothetical protein [Desnuesiella massiliensis]
MKKYRFLIIITFIVFLGSLAFNIYDAKKKLSMKADNYIFCSSTLSYLASDFIEGYKKEFGKALSLTSEEKEHKNDTIFKVKYQSDLTEEEKKDFDMITLSKDYVLALTNIENSHNNIDLNDWEYLKGTSDHKLPVGTNYAADFVNRYLGSKIAYKVAGENLSDYIVKDKNLMGFIYASQYYTSTKYKLVTINGLKMKDENYPLVDYLVFIVKKDFNEKEKISQIISNMNFNLDKFSFNY